ncbi:hypothetical protein HYDPIDRAFT_141417 [Hydnomerulius pinastri MD-312]|uniref:G domain-containing protein n=1 Tax=Hydnomerulius pinastri MD-312 TaxID=994086 RepID=A0A0C9W746_9AGAM|nr:hypothetical protein HYDPIDRAFT_141417 [Hydnomerulius pinastri MD-312]
MSAPQDLASRAKKRISRFRILIIGRANAGKTTILQRVCRSTENPEIYDRYGKKIDGAIIEGTAERGLHDIENEMIFKSNPGFVFHDSRGFEAGGTDELNKVKTFIAARANEKSLPDRLHAIWYCIPMDDHHRAFTAAEIGFFTCGTGSVPVIVLFTKMDALCTEAFQKLTEGGMSKDQAFDEAAEHANKMFEDMPHVKHLYNKKNTPYPPKSHVCLHEMHKLDADSSGLIEETTSALGDDVLKQLFVSTQQTNMEICMKYALKRYDVLGLVGL